MILVSACLTGEKCKYSGVSNDCAAVRRFLAGHAWLPFCPELLAGLGVPRPPAELAADGKVWNQEGQDVSAAFASGAARSLSLAQESQAELVILKDGSPSCGVHHIYDGTFTHQTIPGLGITARLLCEHGFKVISEADLPQVEAGGTKNKL